MLAMLFQIFFFGTVSPLSMFVSLPVWRTTVCSSPWGSPAAPPLLSGWISSKSVLVAANSFMHWEREDFYYLPPDWLHCLPPHQVSTSLDCSLQCHLQHAVSPAFACPPLPEMLAECFSTRCCFSCARLPFCPPPHKIQVSPTTGKNPQSSSFISLML